MPEQLFLGRGGQVDPNTMTADDLRNLADRPEERVEQNFDEGMQQQALQNLGSAFGGAGKIGGVIQSMTDRLAEKLMGEAKKDQTTASKGKANSLDTAAALQKKIAELRKKSEQVASSGTGNTAAQGILDNVIQNLMSKLSGLQNQGIGEL